MKKILVTYLSNTSFTKTYANMIAQQIECDVISFKEMTAEKMCAYQTVIFGTRAHAGRIDGYMKAKEMFQNSTAEDFIVFVTGAMPNSAQEIIDEFWKQNLSEDEIKHIPHFYMQSGLCFEKMSLSDKAMIKIAAVMIKHKKDKNDYEKEFEKAIVKSYDISSITYTKPLVSYLKENY